jgi:hypothetical protein
MAVTYEPIATANGTGSSATITFSSIPSTYTDLRVIIQATSPASGQYVSPAIQFNSDTGANYGQTLIWGDGSTTGSYRANSANKNYAGPQQVGVQNANPCIGIVDVLSYAGSTFKTSLVSASIDNNGSGSVERFVTCWRNTSAITTIAVISQGDPFSTSTVVTIYGIKAA